MPTAIDSMTVGVNSAATDASGWLVTIMQREAVTGVFSHVKTVPPDQ
jgi:hypothetical protein